MHDDIMRAKYFLQDLSYWCKDTTALLSRRFVKAEIEADPLLIIVIALVVVFFLGSAFWALSIASSRRHNPQIAFLLGLALPWVFPLLILFTMDVKGERARRRQEAREQKERDEAAALRAEEERRAAEEALAKDFHAKWTQSYFEKLARKADGSPAGPFAVGFAGQTLRVEQIVEVQPTLVLVEFKDAHGEIQRMRIPFAKIDHWENC
ncbi:MAG: hypothetical protein GX945_09045 [Lentisphaerae bacterium]|nr:hypothetical protein [Lentisphaerota bacterium]